MKLAVPFFKQTTLLNCGPTALKMVLEYLGDSFSIKYLEEKTGIKEGKALYTIQIAIAAALMGYKAKFYSKHLLFNEDNMKFEFYKDYSEMDMKTSIELADEAKKLGIKLEERTLQLSELLSHVKNDSVPIIILNWNVLTNQEGYRGHFVPIVGYDTENILIHNQGLKDSQAFMPIKREIFELARKSEGTDEDIVIIYKK
ncbi:MAG: peptidase C39 family protein [Candidatus Nanoarchaeia archaeon]|jgi:ABC-type bacteriocin/lantibiotic exporter with double-glycine peptidase domain